MGSGRARARLALSLRAARPRRGCCRAILSRSRRSICVLRGRLAGCTSERGQSSSGAGVGGCRPGRIVPSNWRRRRAVASGSRPAGLCIADVRGHGPQNRHPVTSLFRRMIDPDSRRRRETADLVAASANHIPTVAAVAVVPGHGRDSIVSLDRWTGCGRPGLSGRHPPTSAQDSRHRSHGDQHLAHRVLRIFLSGADLRGHIFFI
jgi:hypothetical protein